MTDALAPWANLGMLLVVGGIVTLVLILVAATAEGRSRLLRRAGAVGTVAAFGAGLAVAVVAVFEPGDFWLDLAAWGVWIGGAIVVFALTAALSAIGGPARA